jgi:methylisocitrate lyase
MTTASASDVSPAPRRTPEPARGDQLRRLLDTSTVGLPGAFNGLAARLAKDAGFESLYVSGAAVTASFGVPDVGLLGLPEFCNVIHQVSRGSGLPVLADADTGFGEAEMVARTVHEYHRAGAAGLHIEDQVFPKRCGHLDGKTLVPIEHFQEKVAFAAKARDAIDGGPGDDGNGHGERGSFVVCARTDAAGVDGLDAAIERAKAYVDAGADMIFPEGLRTLDEFAAFAEAIHAHGGGPSRKPGREGSAYLLANMTEFGKTPITPLGEFETLGYDCVIWPVSTLRSAMGAVRDLLSDLRREGSVESRLDQMLTRQELYAALRYTPGEPWVYGG